MKLNKNQKLIILILLGVIIILLGVCAYFVINHNGDNNSNNTQIDNTVVNETLNDDRAYEILYNAYLVSYIIEGDVKLGDGKLEEKGEETYYAVNDPLFKGIHSIEEINKLINDTLVSPAAVDAIEKLNSGSYNRYIEFNGTLYVIKMEETCDFFSTINLVKSDLRFDKDEKGYILFYGTMPTRLYHDDIDGKLKLGYRIIGCVPVLEDEPTNDEEE